MRTLPKNLTVIPGIRAAGAGFPRWLRGLALAVALTAGAPAALAYDDTQAAAELPIQPGPNFVWEEGCVRPDGEVVQGFWRPREEAGYAWQDAGWDADGNWIDYDFVPEESAPPGYVWVPGYRTAEGQWQLGAWRKEQREGFKWREGTYESDDYVAPDWEPEQAEPETVYEQGYRAPTGYWVDGFSRPVVRSGYNWVPGYWDGLTYVSGYWYPVAVRSNAVYEAGYVGTDGYWVDGFYREPSRSGYAWVDGYYVADTWVWGFWRPSVIRTGYAWEAGCVSGGVWIDGFWRPTVRTGSYWLPGYYNRGIYMSGGWIVGRPPVLVSDPYYYRYSRYGYVGYYHNYQVVYGRPYPGPFYRMGRSALWSRPAVYQPIRRPLSAQRQMAATARAPYRTASARPAGPAPSRLPVASARPGQGRRDVHYGDAGRPTRAPSSASARPERNPSFQRPTGPGRQALPGANQVVRPDGRNTPARPNAATDRSGAADRGAASMRDAMGRPTATERPVPNGSGTAARGEARPVPNGSGTAARGEARPVPNGSGTAAQGAERMGRTMPSDRIPTRPVTERPYVGATAPRAGDRHIERPVTGRTPSERPTFDRPTTQRPETSAPRTFDRPAADRPVERPAVERPAVERPAVERPVAAPRTFERPAAERPAVERPVTRPSVERPVERPAVERPVTRPSVERPVSTPRTFDRPVERQPATRVEPSRRPVERQPATRVEPSRPTAPTYDRAPSRPTYTAPSRPSYNQPSARPEAQPSRPSFDRAPSRRPPEATPTPVPPPTYQPQIQPSDRQPVRPARGGMAPPARRGR